MIYLLFFLAIFMSVLGYSAWRRSRYDGLLERLTFGFQEGVEEAQEDLSAGDFGLTGRELFYYRLQSFFESVKGRLLLFSLGAAIGLATSLLSGMNLSATLSSSVVCGLGLFLLAVVLLRRRKRVRERMIRKELPSMLELIAAIMEGGIAFEAAMALILREADPKHPLYFDINIINEAMRRGRRRADALRLWAARCNLPEIADITSSLIQADQAGSSIGAVLRHHGHSLLRENEAEIQRRAERLPLRMLLPMMLTILPSVMVVAALPFLLKIFRVMEQIMGGVAR